MRKADEVFLCTAADRAEKAGDLVIAWKVVAELAYSKPPFDPIHARLATIETRLKNQPPPGRSVQAPPPRRARRQTASRRNQHSQRDEIARFLDVSVQ